MNTSSMSEVELEKAKAIALTTARLQAILHKAKQDEARLKQFLEMRRLKRRLRARKVM